MTDGGGGRVAVGVAMGIRMARDQVFYVLGRMQKMLWSSVKYGIEVTVMSLHVHLSK